jgi:serine/threonine protein kinase
VDDVLKGPLSPGTVVDDRFEIISRIGGGGGGDVFRARHLILNKDMALKVLKGKMSPEHLERTRREVRVLASLNHPNVAKINTVGTIDGRLFMAIELIKGRSLAEHLAHEGALSPERAWPILLDICRAMKYVHANDILFRDLKPSNVMLAEHTDRAILVDFGLARIEHTSQEITADGAILGTIQYLAPEIWTGGKATKQADIYAFGCLIFETLAGKPLFEGQSDVDLMRAHLDAALPDLPGFCAHILRRCLDKNPEHRYASFDEIAGDLENVDPSRTSDIRTPVVTRDYKVAISLLVLFGLSLLVAAVCFQEKTNASLIRINPDLALSNDLQKTVSMELQEHSKSIPASDKANAYFAMAVSTREQSDVALEYNLKGLAAASEVDQSDNRLPLILQKLHETLVKHPMLTKDQLSELERFLPKHETLWSCTDDTRYHYLNCLAALSKCYELAGDGKKAVELAYKVADGRRGSSLGATDCIDSETVVMEVLINQYARHSTPEYIGKVRKLWKRLLEDYFTLRETKLVAQNRLRYVAVLDCATNAIYSAGVQPTSKENYDLAIIKIDAGRLAPNPVAKISYLSEGADRLLSVAKQGEPALAKERHEEALKILHEVVSISRQYNAPAQQAHALHVLANEESSRNNFIGAANLARQALALMVHSERWDARSVSSTSLAIPLASLGRHKEALKYLKEASEQALKYTEAIAASVKSSPQDKQAALQFAAVSASRYARALSVWGQNAKALKQLEQFRAYANQKQFMPHQFMTNELDLLIAQLKDHKVLEFPREKTEDKLQI